jgi:hypothetical protein
MNEASFPLLIPFTEMKLSKEFIDYIQEASCLRNKVTELEARIAKLEPHQHSFVCSVCQIKHV